VETVAPAEAVLTLLHWLGTKTCCNRQQSAVALAQAHGHASRVAHCRHNKTCKLGSKTTQHSTLHSTDTLPPTRRLALPVVQHKLISLICTVQISHQTQFPNRQPGVWSVIPSGKLFCTSVTSHMGPSNSTILLSATPPASKALNPDRLLTRSIVTVLASVSS